MNFNGIANYEKNIQTAVTDMPSAADKMAMAKAANASALGNLGAGSIVTGEIEDISGKMVRLRLPDAQLVTAKLEADVRLSVGQSLAFAIKSNTGTQIALTPLFGSEAVNPAAIKALGQASIMVTKDTLSMATAMMDGGMGIDKNSMQLMLRQVNRFPDANPADIVAMLKQGIAVSAESIEQYGIYKNNEHQLMNMANELSESMGEILDELTENLTRGDAAKLLKLTEQFNGESTPEITAELKKGLDEQVTEYVKQLQMETDALAENKKPQGILDIMAREQSAADKAAVIADANAEPAEAAVLKAAENPEGELGRILDASMREQLAEGLKALGAGTAAINSVLDGTMSPGDALKYLQSAAALYENQTLDRLALPPEEIEKKLKLVKELSGSDIYKNLLKDSMVKGMTLKPDGDLSAQKINDFYNKLVHLADSTNEMLQSMGKGDSAMAKNLDAMKQDISFMNQLNESFNYVQLPVQLTGDNAHGDLYVYANKKKLMDKDGEITALLHLEMEAMGTMDIHVALKDGNNVRTDFTLENEELLDFVEANIGILDERLTKRGYNVSIKTSLKDKADDTVNPAIDAMLKPQAAGMGHLVAKYSFDVKA